MKIDIKINVCKDKNELITRFYDTLAIRSPRGLNWDALDENLRNIKNISDIKLIEQDLCLNIIGFDEFSCKITHTESETLKNILINATDIRNRIDNLHCYIAFSN